MKFKGTTRIIKKIFEILYFSFGKRGPKMTFFCFHVEKLAYTSNYGDFGKRWLTQRKKMNGNTQWLLRDHSGVGYLSHQASNSLINTNKWLPAHWSFFLWRWGGKSSFHFFVIWDHWQIFFFSKFRTATTAPFSLSSCPSYSIIDAYYDGLRVASLNPGIFSFSNENCWTNHYCWQYLHLNFRYILTPN